MYMWTENSLKGGNSKVLSGPCHWFDARRIRWNFEYLPLCVQELSYDHCLWQVLPLKEHLWYGFSGIFVGLIGFWVDYPDTVQYANIAGSVEILAAYYISFGTSVWLYIYYWYVFLFMGAACYFSFKFSISFLILFCVWHNKYDVEGCKRKFGYGLLRSTLVFCMWWLV